LLLELAAALEQREALNRDIEAMRRDIQNKGGY